MPDLVAADSSVSRSRKSVEMICAPEASAQSRRMVVPARASRVSESAIGVDHEAGLHRGP